MQCEHCDERATIHITIMKEGNFDEQHLCDKCANQFLQNLPRPARVFGRTELNAKREVPVEVDKVIISEIHDQQVVMFREVQGSRCLPLVCGIFEVTTVDRTLKAIPSPRPLTHDAWLLSLAALGATVEEVCIHELDGHTYFAEIRLLQEAKKIKVDARPSDALIIALKVGAPILVAERLLSYPG